MKRTTVTGVLALALSVGTSGCVGTKGTEAKAPEGSPSGNRVLLRFTNDPLSPVVVGRAAATENGEIRIAWAGTTATVKFEGTGASVDITDTGDNHYLVLVDGAPLEKKLRPKAGRSTLELISGLERKVHTVTLYKLTEPLVGSATIHGFVLDASAKPLPQVPSTKKRIEILGDSISAGYGNEGANETCGFSPETENHFLTYGALAARKLDADLTTLAWSGKGVFSNRGSATDKDTLPVLFERTLPMEAAPYDFSAKAPEAVILNLGTNDFAPEVPDFSPFEPSYDAFVGRVREKYPKAHLFVMFGPMMTDGYPEGRKAYTTARAALTSIVERRSKAGDSKLSFFEVERAPAEEGLGCDWHPSLKTHARMAETVIRELKEKAGF